MWLANMVHARAKQMWIDEGRPEGCALCHHLRAKWEIVKRIAEVFYEQQGCPEGDGKDDDRWLRAERLVEDSLAGQQ